MSDKRVPERWNTKIQCGVASPYEIAQELYAAEVRNEKLDALTLNRE